MNPTAWMKTATIGVAGLGLVGCATNTGTDALIGGGTGAAIGAILTRGHAGGAIVGGALGALTGAAIGSQVDRAEAIRNSYYYDGRIYAYPPPPPPPGYYETRTVYHNPDGSVTTYVDRYPY
jgi:hypothetical protein